jgi:hypothetical protein
MQQLPADIPAPPQVSVSGTKLTWKGKGTSSAVYRVQGDKATLLAVRRGGNGSLTVPDAAGTYCVTALDRSWNESTPAR